MRKTQARLIQESKFKPKTMIIDGVSYNVDSLDKLDKIKEEIRAKKRHDADILEEQKNQKVLITKTRIGNTDQKITKVITDIGMMPDRNKRRIVVPKPPPGPEKPKFVLKAATQSRKLVVPMRNMLSDDNYTSPLSANDDTFNNDTFNEGESERKVPFETIYRGANDIKQNNSCNLTQCNPGTSTGLTVKSHPRREIPKLKTRDELTAMNNVNNDEDQKVILINQSNAYCADYVNGYESKAPKFQIKTHDRKPIAKDGLMSQEESFRLRNGNNNDENDSNINGNENISIDENTEMLEERKMNIVPSPQIQVKPKVSVISHSNKIKKLTKRDAEPEINSENQEEVDQKEQIKKTEIEKTEPKKMTVVSHANKIKQLTHRAKDEDDKINDDKINDDEMNKIEDTFVNLALNTNNEKKSLVKPDKKSPVKQEKVNEIKEISENDSINGFFNEQYQVVKSEWYVLAVKSRGNNEGLIKILDDNKSQMMPSLKINNDMFVYRKYDNKVNEYRIYVKTLRNSTKADIYIIGLDIMNVKFQQVSFNIVQKSVDLWKLRKLYDLDFINYYLSNLKFDCSEKFIERFNADYKLYKNPDLFDNFISNLKLDLTKLPKDEEFYKDDNKENILYLVQSSIEYEQCGYTVRSQNMIKNLNSNEKYTAIGVSRYGYPHDKEEGYFSNTPEELTMHDGITYFKLLNSNDNYNSNNIIDYIKKYIVSVIKLAVKTNAKIIYAVSNYWNGLAAMYASKFLGIKSIYELRGFWDENVVISKSELKGSNMIKMLCDQEHKIIKNVDLIVTNNQILGDKVLEILNDSSHSVKLNAQKQQNSNSESPILHDDLPNPEKERDKLKIIYDTVDTERFKPNNDKRKELREKHNISENEIIIGYIGTITNYQGIEYTLECLKLLLAEKEKVKFVLIGSGPHEDNIHDYIDELELGDNVITLGKINYDIIHEYYNMMDIMIYPKKAFDWCKHTTSYKITEAMSMGKAIIMSNFMKQEGVISMEPENLNDLFEKVKMLITDPEKRNSYGEKARQWILENRQNSKICLLD